MAETQEQRLERLEKRLAELDALLEKGIRLAEQWAAGRVALKLLGLR